MVNSGREAEFKQQVESKDIGLPSQLTPKKPI